MSYKKSIAPVLALFMGVALLHTGSGLQGVLLPIRASLENFASFELGMLGALYYVGFTAGCFLSSALIARVGHIRSYLALISIASAVILLQAVFVHPVIWWGLRAVSGFSFAVLYIIIESWLNERSSNENRGALFSVYMMINFTVIIAGQMMLALGDPASFALFALVSILISLAGVPVAMTNSPSPAPIPFVKPDLVSLYKVSPAAFLGCFGHGMAAGAFWSLGPVFAMTGNFDAAGAGLFMSATVLGGVIGQWPLGRLSDRVDRRYIIVFNCLLASITGLILSYYRQDAQNVIIALSFCYGLFAFPIYALVVAHANDMSEPQNYVATSSGLMLLYGIGSVLGPVLTSLSHEYIADRSLFSFTALVYTLTACLVVIRIVKRAPVEEDEKVIFSDVLVATRTYAPLDVIDEPENK